MTPMTAGWFVLQKKVMTGTWYVTYIFLPSPFKHLPSDFRCHSPVPVTFRKGKEKLKVE
jgi:hypothetical protein